MSGWTALSIRIDHALIDRLLKEFELPSKKTIDRLSYGQKKKFLISFAVATEGRSMSVTVETPLNHLRWIQPENAHFTLKDFAAKVLQISLDKSRMSLEGRAPFNMGNVTINGTAESHIICRMSGWTRWISTLIIQLHGYPDGLQNWPGHWGKVLPFLHLWQQRLKLRKID